MNSIAKDMKLDLQVYDFYSIMEYRLQGNRKAREGEDNPDRNEHFCTSMIM
jgi:VanZ family protein